MAITNYSVEDMHFPKSFDLLPCPNVIGKMKLLLAKIKLLYKSKLKKQPQELFDRKTMEAQALPEYTEVRKIIKKVETDVPEFLSRLESSVVADGEINVAPVKGSPIQKMVSSWWRKSTCSLAVLVLWFSKHRSGVISNMLMSEWLVRKQQEDKTVGTVAKHKTGDKEPSLIVLSADLAALLERYYRIRFRVRTTRKEFFITNTCGRVVKIYDDVNKIYKLQDTKSQLSACVFRRMIESESRGHDSTTCAGVAKALQHDPETALRYYQVPDTNEAIRRQAHIDVVDHTKLLKDMVAEELDTLFPLEPYANLNDLDAIREKLEDSNAKAMYPKANITDAYLNQIRENFNKQVAGERVNILVEILMADYTRDNISKQAIIDAAKRKKLHYFLKHDADKICRKVMNRF
ncbi:unnamed protein product [Macrosiphum euphorbiae]|uniref:Uncharacterized protein n=1 Tax=Macrosiphum euphorbiae TaxID=13131 RepID=A0AAV0WP15_9HEMI|nr:unnamed protein product [Macrosiphum euphorbiae]